MFLFISLFLCACKYNVVEKDHKTIKIDVEQDFLYIKNEYTIPFHDDQKAYAPEDPRIDSYVININTESAKNITGELQSKAMKQISDIKKLDNGLIARCETLTGKAIVSNDFITILIEKYPFIEGSEQDKHTVETYYFDKNNGESISKKTFLETMNLTNEKIIEKVKKQFKEQNIVICGDMPGECYFEPQIYENDEFFPDTNMYVNEDNDLMIYMRKSRGLSYDWEPVTIKLDE